MTSLIFSLVPMIFIIYYFSILRKRKIVTWELKSGIRCYSCKDEFPGDDRFGNSRRICKKCERDKSLNLLLGRKKESFIIKVKDILLDDKFQKWNSRVIYSMLGLSIIGTFIGFLMKIDNCFNEITNCLNVVLWTTMIIQLKISSIKKPKT